MDVSGIVGSMESSAMMLTETPARAASADTSL